MKKKFLLMLSLILTATLTFLSACGGDYAPTENNKDLVNGNGELMPGQLTAAAYSDNQYYDFWYDMLNGRIATNTNFYNYNQYYPKNVRTGNRLKIILPNCEYAEVCLLDNDYETQYGTVTDKNGVCYLFAPARQEDYLISIKYWPEKTAEPMVEYRKVQGIASFEEIVGVTPCEQIIQLMYVIDTTGSMGDELEYLQSEIADTIDKIKLAFNNITVELSIVIYRDYGDMYVTHYSEFTTEIELQQSYLRGVSARGGGDFEEAVQVAFSDAVSRNWKDNAATKLLFHVADAPAHNEDVSNWFDSVHTLSKNGVRIITVASSGIDKRTEFLFRSQCLLTQGTYVYLTDESGKGDAHLEATVYERPIVEYLNSCMIRLIKGYHTGQFEAPIFYRDDRQHYDQ